MKKKRVFTVCVISVLCVLVCVRLPVIPYLTQVSSYFLYPVLVVHYHVASFKDRWCTKTVSDKTRLAALEALQQECDILRAENTNLKATLGYVNDTKELVRFKEGLEHVNDIIAQVIVRYSTEEEQYILINVGTSSHVAKDMVVLAQNNLVGRVVAVYPWYAKVQLSTDPNSYIASYMVGTNAHGIHTGTGSAVETVIERVSHLDDVRVGDDVLTSGEGLIFPRGYRLGTVISKVPVGLYYEVRVKPAIDPYALRYCLVHARDQ
jgi:rod shape-determining protein MreC